MATQLWCCDYCDFQDESRTYVERHEKICNSNPANQEEEAEVEEEES